MNGVALAHKELRVCCFSSDGSQMEGNSAEAARLAVAQGLNVKLLAPRRSTSAVVCQTASDSANDAMARLVALWLLLASSEDCEDAGLLQVKKGTTPVLELSCEGVPWSTERSTSRGRGALGHLLGLLRLLHRKGSHARGAGVREPLERRGTATRTSRHILQRPHDLFS